MVESEIRERGIASAQSILFSFESSGAQLKEGLMMMQDTPSLGLHDCFRNIFLEPN